MLLTPHPRSTPVAVRSIDAAIRRDGGQWHLRYLVEGTDLLVIPDPAVPGRADGLWRTTCFEAFAGDPGAAYREFNFSPSGQWAAYAFDAPRIAMREAAAHVTLRIDAGATWLCVEAAIAADLSPGTPLGLSAVIEEQGGVTSYWALAHPPGDAPDFHQRDCFVARLL